MGGESEPIMVGWGGGGYGGEGRQLGRLGAGELTANSLMFQNGCSTDEKPTMAMRSSRTWSSGGCRVHQSHYNQQHMCCTIHVLKAM